MHVCLNQGGARDSSRQVKCLEGCVTHPVYPPPRGMQEFSPLHLCACNRPPCTCLNVHESVCT